MNTNNNTENKIIKKERFFTPEQIQDAMKLLWGSFADIEDCAEGFSTITEEETSVRFEFKHGGVLSFSLKYPN